MQPWRTLARRTILNHSQYLEVESHTIELPDGQVISDWPWVISPDYVNVLAITAEGKYICFHQTKYGVEGTSLAPVGGYMDPGEEPLDAAKRELLEETGYEAPEWISLGGYRVDANRGLNTAYFYVAREARCVTERHADDLEEQQLLLLSHAEMDAALEGGEFKVLPWAAIVAAGLRYIEKHPANAEG